MAAPIPLQIIEDPAQAQAILDPTRARLLASLAAPDSAGGLARRFGLPRQRLNYHLRELERVGLVRFIREQRKGNCTERIVQAIALKFVISPEVLARPAPAEPSPETPMRSPFAAGIDVRFATPADHAAFVEDLMNEAAKLAAEYAPESRTESPAVTARLFVLSLA